MTTACGGVGEGEDLSTRELSPPLLTDHAYEYLSNGLQPAYQGPRAQGATPFCLRRKKVENEVDLLPNTAQTHIFMYSEGL